MSKTLDQLAEEYEKSIAPNGDFAAAGLAQGFKAGYTVAWNNMLTKELALDSLKRDNENVSRENAKLRELCGEMAKALKACETEIERYYEKMEQENRKQTIWRDDHDLWYGRDCAYEVLKRYKETVGEWDND